jgi:serine/threonine protein kinase
MELLSGGDLFDYIVQHTPMPEHEARRIFQQIIAGVEHCHANRVVHRDLKPENIMMDSTGNIKIGDFGLSAEMKEGELLHDSCGSPDYVAPELLYENPAYEGPEVDVWSCGAILYTLLCNRLPFEGSTLSELIRKVKKGKYHVTGSVSGEAKDLLAKILCLDPKERLSIAAIKAHHWFAQDLPLERTNAPASDAEIVPAATPGSISSTSQEKMPCDKNQILEGSRYDFGSSLLPNACAACGKLVLNRGCAKCSTRFCQSCFGNHICVAHDSLIPVDVASKVHQKMVEASTITPCVTQ